MRQDYTSVRNSRKRAAEIYQASPISAWKMHLDLEGKMTKKNCSTWAEYEPLYSSPTATLCHGGHYGGRHFQACPAKEECRRATIAAANEEDDEEEKEDTRPRRHLAIYPQAQRPVPTATRTPALTHPLGQFLPTTLASRSTESAKEVTTLARESRYSEEEGTSRLRRLRPVVPPSDYPAAMQTPYVMPHDMGIPVHLPVDGEHAVDRLLKNVVQAGLAAIAGQIWNYLRAVDLFRG